MRLVVAIQLIGLHAIGQEAVVVVFEVTLAHLRPVVLSFLRRVVILNTFRTFFLKIQRIRYFLERWCVVPALRRILELIIVIIVYVSIEFNGRAEYVAVREQVVIAGRVYLLLVLVDGHLCFIDIVVFFCGVANLESSSSGRLNCSPPYTFR